MIRKVDENNNDVWAKFYDNQPARTSFIIDSPGSYIYFMFRSLTSIIICKINTLNGGVVQTISLTSSGIYCDSDSCKLLINSDQSKIYSNGINASNYANICKFPINFSSVDCYRFPNMYYIHNSIYINSDDIYYSGKLWGPTNNIQSVRVDISTTGAIVWSDYVACTNTCSTGVNKVTLNDDKTLLYNFVVYENYGFFTCLNSTDGTMVSNRYRTSTTPNGSTDMSYKNKKVYFGFSTPTLYHLIIYTVATDSISEYISNISMLLYHLNFEPYTNRLVMYGYKNTVQYCYLAKSLESLLSNHSNFSSTTTTMVIVSPSSNEFLANTTATVSHVSDTVSPGASVTEFQKLNKFLLINKCKKV